MVVKYFQSKVLFLEVVFVKREALPTVWVQCILHLCFISDSPVEFHMLPAYGVLEQLPPSVLKAVHPSTAGELFVHSFQLPQVSKVGQIVRVVVIACTRKAFVIKYLLYWVIRDLSFNVLPFVTEQASASDQLLQLLCCPPTQQTLVEIASSPFACEDFVYLASNYDVSLWIGKPFSRFDIRPFNLSACELFYSLSPSGGMGSQERPQPLNLLITEN